LKVAPEHCAPNVLSHMGKPTIEAYDKFREKYMRLSAECGKEQYLVPYLMSSHPGSTMDDAAHLALYTKKIGLAPEQVQDFYPTPGTASTVMYYTGIDPFTGKKVYTATDYHEKQLQRALLQWRHPENRRKIYEAMNYCSEEGVKDLRELLGMPREERVKEEKTPTREKSRQNRGERYDKTKKSAQNGGKNKKFDKSEKYGKSGRSDNRSRPLNSQKKPAHNQVKQGGKNKTGKK
ncbi:MAG: DUF3362 domain-containing protein, partial [Ruminococcaceae bacterium]|nr:DUF3362 domain-containing protein [Oscillospiraceae bacterium]